MRNRVLSFMAVLAIVVAGMMFTACDSLTGPDPNWHLITTPVDNQVFYIQHTDGHTFVSIRICWRNGPSQGDYQTIKIHLLGYNGSPDDNGPTIERKYPGPDSCITVRFDDIQAGYYSVDVIWGNHGLASGRFYIKNR